MELNLEREHINYYDIMLDTDLYQEETMEAIVPDACPDILRIVDVCGQVFLAGKNVHDGGVSVSGTVNVWVMYQPEDGQDLCKVEVHVPFTIRSEAAGLSSQGRCVAMPCLRGLDARDLNPRKLLVRAEVGLTLQVFQPKELMLCSGIACEETAAIQQRTGQHTLCTISMVQEKEFTFYDELHLSAGPAGKTKLLSVLPEVWCTESKIIGNKLIFKGEAALQVRYQVENELCSVRCPMSFSQIIEVSEAGEAADCQLNMCVTDIDYTLVGEDERTLNVTVQILGQATVRDRRPVSVLLDAYSTVHHMITEQDSCTMVRQMDRAVRTQSARELLETAVPVKNVIDASVSVSGMRESREDDQLVVSADLRMNVLYLDEQDQPQALNKILTVSGRIDLPAQGRCRCQCQCPGEVFAVPAAGGVEVRFSPEFHCLMTQQQTISVITAAKLGEERANRQGSQPSVVLRLAAPDEDLWDIAKAYSTTQERILQANQLEEETLPAGQMLLIPSIR